jgi:NAD-dependent deacetylase
MSADPIQHAADALRRAHRAVAFTGAGISVPSGIPDYRSREGLWERDDPMVVASYSNFRRDHTQFYAWFRKTMTSMGDARPNVAHHALVELQRMGHLAAVITQNIDGLHSRAGNDPVYELHGHLRTMTCLKCYANCTAAPYIAQLLDTGDVPTCAACGSVLKPDIIMFGEQLPIATLQAARAAAHQADLILVKSPPPATLWPRPCVALRRSSSLICNVPLRQAIP